MRRFLLYDECVEVPDWVVDLESFRRWTDDDAFPERGQITFFKGDVWVDMSKEQLFDHNLVKTECTRVVANLEWVLENGLYFSDGAFLSNADADVSNQPDGVFVSTTTLDEKKVTIVEGKEHGHVELEGSPDMALEVVSDSSVEKDTVLLRQAYAIAGIREYWLIDAREEPAQFDILRLTARGYVAGRKRLGWVRSEVFNRWFRLSPRVGPGGYTRFRLEVQEERPK